ncbi:hypothetical protein GCM10027452_27080 [Micromonospora halotolerans]
MPETPCTRNSTTSTGRSSEPIGVSDIDLPWQWPVPGGDAPVPGGCGLPVPRRFKGAADGRRDAGKPGGRRLPEQ